MAHGFPAQYQPVVDAGGRVTQPWNEFFQALWNRTGAALANATVQTGVVLDFAGPAANAPTGFLVCDGSAVSRSAYANLFAAIGTTWGAGDGLATFNLPNFNNTVAMGGATAGAMGGSSTATLTAANLPPGVNLLSPASNVTAGAAAGGVTASGTGQGVAFSILPPFAIVIRIIKT
jgi:microcystin-dependent protein